MCIQCYVFISLLYPTQLKVWYINSDIFTCFVCPSLNSLDLELLKNYIQKRIKKMLSTFYYCHCHDCESPFIFFFYEFTKEVVILYIEKFTELFFQLFSWAYPLFYYIEMVFSEYVMWGSIYLWVLFHVCSFWFVDTCFNKIWLILFYVVNYNRLLK